MDRQTIAQLAWYIPNTADAKDLVVGGSISNIDDTQVNSILHYANCFSNLAFGWDFVNALKSSQSPFPAFLSGKDIYLWRAYNYLAGHRDKAISGALSLTLPSRETLRTQINALLIGKDVDANYVAKHLNIDVEAIDAYEKLFFNVIDRKRDHAFIANVVYPEGRLVEGYSDYIENAKLDELLLRAGFQYGPQHVLYAVGLGKNPFVDLDVASGAQKMDALFMSDGCLYATMGWLNSWHHRVPIENARLSLQATKMGGGNTETTGGVDGLGIGDMLRDSLIMDATIKAETKSKLYKEGILETK